MLAVYCIPYSAVNAVFPGLMLPDGEQTESKNAREVEIPTSPEDSASSLYLVKTGIELLQLRSNDTDLFLDARPDVSEVERSQY